MFPGRFTAALGPQGPSLSQPLAPLVSTQQGTVPGVHLGSQSWDAALNSAWAFSLQTTKGRGGSRKQTMGSRACLPACPDVAEAPPSSSSC